MEFLSELNEAQRAAAKNVVGPTMIIAGAGSGKTRTLTYRLAFIIDQGHADPFEILALTFTNKAAKEMKERIAKLVGPEARNIWMGTFHSLFARMLRYEAEKIGFTKNFTIYDTDDSQSMLRKIVKELKLDDKTYKPKVLYFHISSAKNALVDPLTYTAEYVTDSFTNSVARIYTIYQNRLLQSNAMDFDDLLMKPIELFEKHPESLRRWQDRFRFIMVDEYQDTNHAQYVICKMLSASHRNICVVGDDAQSIYSFRGANIKNILNFRKDYPETQVYKLEQNYRSTGTIVEAANSIIARNKNQIKKKVFTENDKGDLIKVMEASSEAEEGRLVTDSIREQIMRKNFQYKDFAVLYRTNAQSRAIETELRRANVKYKIFGGLSFYKRKEIKDVLAYLKLAVNPVDEAALIRVLNYPTRGIGKTTQDKIAVQADQHNLKLWEALRLVNEWPVSGRAKNSIRAFVEKIEYFGVVAGQKNAAEAATVIAKESGILKELHSDNDIESLSRWENVQELLNAAQEFVEDTDNDSDKLDAFLAEVSLFTDQDEKLEDTNFVTLMTIHAAKGLEFPSVFLVGLEEELFPSAMSMQSRADLEEERRLFYVAVTRAKHHLTLSYAKSRYKFGAPQYNPVSRFLQEVDEEFVTFPKKDSPLPHKMRETRQIPGPSLRPLRNPRKVSRGGESSSNTFKGDDLAKLAEGMRVEHHKFGKGRVEVLEGSGSERKATVFFQNKGKKVLLLKYAKLRILS